MGKTHALKKFSSAPGKEIVKSITDEELRSPGTLFVFVLAALLLLLVVFVSFSLLQIFCQNPRTKQY